MFVYFTKQDMMINMNNIAAVQLYDNHDGRWVQFDYINPSLGVFKVFVSTKENGYHIINRILEARKNGDKAITI